MVEVGAAVAKALVSSATAAGRALLASKTGRLRTAFRAHKAAQTAGLPIGRTAIYRWLSRADTRAFLGYASVNSAPSSIAAIKLLMEVGATDDQAQTLIEMILHEFIASLPQSEATAVAHDQVRSTVTGAERAIAAQVADATSSLAQRIDASRSFDESLARIGAWRADAARQLRLSFPPIEMAVDAIAASSDPGLLLQEWSEHPPKWLAAAPAEVLTWLAEMSSDFGKATAVRSYLSTAIDAGAHPREYWLARRAHHLARHDLPAAMTELAKLTHPLAIALADALGEHHQAALDALTGWTPTRREDWALKAVLESRLQSALGLDSPAIATAEAASHEYPESAALLLLTAELLLIRAANHESATKLHDAARAMEMALRARNARRSWLGDSAEAAVLALKAANMAGDPERAWRISQPAPDGEATPGESHDQRILAEAALTAAMLGRTTTAQSLLTSVTSDFSQAHVGAVIADAQGDSQKADELFRRAWVVASHDGEQLAALMGLAQGGAALPEHSELKSRHLEKVREIETVAEAMSTPGERLTKLRANAHRSMLLTVELARVLTEREDHGSAGDVLAKGAETWGHPTLMAMAADAYYRAGDFDKATTATHSSLTLGGSTWSGRRDAQIRLVHIGADLHRWDMVAEAARGLILLDPHDQDATWALVKALLQLAKPKDAWSALTQNGEPSSPRDPDEAQVWVNLHARFAPKHRYLTAALEVLQPWLDKESVVGTFLPVLYFGLSNRGFEPEPEELSALHETQKQFLEKFPESTYFRTIPVTEEEGGLDALVDQVRATRSPEIDALFEKVRAGEMPLGTLTMVGRSYAEANLHRAAGQVWSTDPDWLEKVSTAPQEGRVVLDTSAARTLNVVDGDLRDRLLGLYTDARVPDRLYRDAARAQDALSLRASLNIAWDAENNRPRVAEISEADQDRLQTDAAALVALLDRATRVPVAEFKHLPTGLRQDDWLSGLELAKAEDLPFWCDDRLLRQLAASFGVTSFSTTDLMQSQLRRQQISLPEFQVNVAALISDFHVDLGFDPSAMELAASMDGWRAAGASNALRRPFAWLHAEEALQFLMKAMGMTQQSAPEELAGWMASGCLGLIRTAGEPSAATANLVILLNGLLSEKWLGPSQLPFLLGGLRTALAIEPETSDPLQPAVAEVFKALSTSAGHGAAQSVLLWLFSQCDDETQSVAARVTLAP